MSIFEQGIELLRLKYKFIFAEKVFEVQIELQKCT